MAPSTSFPTGVSEYTGQAPHITKPTELGHFSLSRQPGNPMVRRYHPDQRALLTLHRRGPDLVTERLDIDLTQGMDAFIDRGQAQKDAEHLYPILRWILENKRTFAQYRSKVNVICWRGRLTDLLVTPYNRKDTWTLVACNIDDIIYLSYVNESDKESKMDSTLEATVEKVPSLEDKRQTSRMYWGFKFEQVMTSPPGDETSLQKSVSNFESFQSVLYTKVGGYRGTGVLFGAEMDCLDPKKVPTKPPDCYVELKTCKGIEDESGMRSFCYHKLMQYWAQSFVCGVPTILVGFRLDNGHVLSTDELPMSKVPLIAQANGDAWKPAVCQNFLNSFLQFVTVLVTESHEQTIYKLKLDVSQQRVVVTREEATAQNQFVPTWYLDQRPGY
ncbi:putative Decapping and exoribonuclease protein [Hypsibius exemplaris]|uniref:Decapping nuclease n=1 Tax=Hypsibius exemplaris TaxID=2072580 RepID=A0A1W0WSP6_HYPEX|nr:putative Decapping and exoribonuclease protein [Hypsibius exemplaris]